MKPLVSFVILTWNSEKYISDCLTSIPNSISSFEYEVIVIDNGSMDNSISLIKNTFNTFKLIINQANRGVAFARNQGIKASNGNYIVILDIDTILNSNSIEEIIQFMERHHEIGLCAPRLMSYSGNIHQNVRRFPTLFSKLCRRINLNFAQRYSNRNFYNLTNINNYLEVDYAVGACQIIRKDAINKIGLMDESIFYGPEDIDFCLRLWLHGWKVIYNPHVSIIHYEQRLTQKYLFSKLTYEHFKGLIYFFIKHGYFIETEALYNRINHSLSNSLINTSVSINSPEFMGKL